MDKLTVGHYASHGTDIHDRLTGQFPLQLGDRLEAATEIESLRDTISRLRDALLRYAYHEEDCAAIDRGLSNCDCGYDELMKELEESK